MDLRNFLKWCHKSLQHEKAGDIWNRKHRHEIISYLAQKLPSLGRANCWFYDLRGIMKLKDWQPSKGRSKLLWAEEALCLRWNSCWSIDIQIFVVMCTAMTPPPLCRLSYSYQSPAFMIDKTVNIYLAVLLRHGMTRTVHRCCSESWACRVHCHPWVMCFQSPFF